MSRSSPRSDWTHRTLRPPYAQTAPGEPGGLDIDGVTPTEEGAAEAEAAAAALPAVVLPAGLTLVEAAGRVKAELGLPAE